MKPSEEAAHQIATFLHSAGSACSTGEYIRLSRRLNETEINTIAAIIENHVAKALSLEHVP